MSGKNTVYKHMHETQEWEMDGMCDNHISVTAVLVTKLYKSLAAAHVTYAQEHNICLEYHGTE